MTEIVDVEITAPDADWLTEFTRRLIEDRLVASGNIDQVRSLYRWADETKDSVEHRVVLHTHRRHVAAIIDRTVVEHPYDVPGVRVVDVTTHPGYATWLTEATDTTVTDL